MESVAEKNMTDTASSDQRNAVLGGIFKNLVPSFLGMEVEADTKEILKMRQEILNGLGKQNNILLAQEHPEISAFQANHCDKISENGGTATSTCTESSPNGNSDLDALYRGFFQKEFDFLEYVFNLDPDFKNMEGDEVEECPSADQTPKDQRGLWARQRETLTQQQEVLVLAKVSEYRELLEDVNKSLYFLIQRHHKDLINITEYVRQIDMALLRASVNVKNARRLLWQFSNDFVAGNLSVMQACRRRDHGKILVHILSQLKFVRDKLRSYKSMLKIDTISAATMCIEIINFVNSSSPQTRQYSFILDIRSSLLKDLPMLYDQTENIFRDVLSSLKTPMDFSVYQGATQTIMMLYNFMKKFDILGSIGEPKSKYLQKIQPRTKITGANVIATTLKCQTILLCEIYVRNELVSYFDFEAREVSVATNLDGKIGADTSLSNTDDLADMLTILPSRHSEIDSRFSHHFDKAVHHIFTIVDRFVSICDWHCRNAFMTDNEKPKYLEEIWFNALEEKQLVWKGVLAILSTILFSPFFQFPNVGMETFKETISIGSKMRRYSEKLGGTCVADTQSVVNQFQEHFRCAFYNAHISSLKRFLSRESWNAVRLSLDETEDIRGFLNGKMIVSSRRSQQAYESSEAGGVRNSPPWEAGASLQAAIEPREYSEISKQTEILTSSSSKESEDNDTTSYASGVTETSDIFEAFDGNETSIWSAVMKSIPQTWTLEITLKDVAVSCVSLTATIEDCIRNTFVNYMYAMEVAEEMTIQFALDLQEFILSYFYALCTCFIPSTLFHQIFAKEDSMIALKCSTLKQFMNTFAEQFRGKNIPEAVSRFSGSNSCMEETEEENKGLANLNEAKINASEESTFEKTRCQSGNVDQGASYSCNTNLSLLLPRVHDTRYAEPQLDHSVGSNNQYNTAKEERILGNKVIVSRMAAAESARFIYHLLDAVGPVMINRLQTAEKAELISLMIENLNQVSSELHDLLQRCAAQVVLHRSLYELGALRAQKFEKMPQAETLFISKILTVADLVSQTRWDRISTLHSEPNDYILKLVHVLQDARIHIEKSCREGAINSVSCTWDALVTECLCQILNGFASVKCCTTEGRALMSLDLAILCRELQNMSPGRTTVIAEGKQRVDNFIKAFYYDSEMEIFEWLRTGSSAHYDLWHIRNLLLFGVGMKMSTPEKNRMLLKLEKMYVDDLRAKQEKKRYTPRQRF